MEALPKGVTVFCPVFNEEELLTPNALRLVSHLEELGQPFEVLIGSNGSTDRTVPRLEALCRADHRIRGFHMSKKGVGAAFRQGVLRARYSKLVTVDMDLSIDLDFIQRAAALLETNHLVIGSKITGSQKRPAFRKGVSTLFIRMAGPMLGITYHDYSIAAKGYRTRLAAGYLGLADDKTFYVVRMVHRANQDGKKITEIPVNCLDMRDSRFNLFHEGVYKFANLFGLWIFSGAIWKTPANWKRVRAATKHLKG